MTRAERLLEELRGLAAALGPAVQPSGYDELLRALTETARRLFGAAACSLALLTDDESELVYTTAAGAGAASVSGMHMPSGHGIAGWVVMSGQPVAISDLQGDARFAREVAEHTGYVPTAILAVPVVSPRRMLGVLSLLDRDTTRGDAEHDMELLGLFAAQAALAIEASAVFRDVGRVLLGALADAAADSGNLRAAIERAATDGEGPDDELTELAALFAALAEQSPADRALALRIVREVAAHTERRSQRPG
ncbi:MAG: GAF domain-containing protein [Mycobacteriales bacterium]|nr:GAF domain-containing protein [Frankia sp.]